MKDIEVSVWDGNKKKILDFITKETESLILPDSVKSYVLGLIINPVNQDNQIFVAVSGTKIVGYLACHRKDNVLSINSIMVSDNKERTKITMMLLKKAHKTLSGNNLEVIELISPIIGNNWLYEPFKMMGFMIHTSKYMFTTDMEISPATQLENLNFVPWRQELDSESAQIIALNDIGDLDIKHELPEREPRQRWLASIREELQGFDPTLCFHAMKGTRLVGLVLSKTVDKVGEIIYLGSFFGNKDREVLKKLSAISLEGLSKQGVDIAKITIFEERRNALESLSEIGFVEGCQLVDALILASDDAWGSLPEEVNINTP
jgi:hypothetical protein